MSFSSNTTPSTHPPTHPYPYSISSPTTPIKPQKPTKEHLEYSEHTLNVVEELDNIVIHSTPNTPPVHHNTLSPLALHVPTQSSNQHTRSNSIDSNGNGNGNGNGNRSKTLSPSFDQLALTARTQPSPDYEIMHSSPLMQPVPYPFTTQPYHSMRSQSFPTPLPVIPQQGNWNRNRAESFADGGHIPYFSSLQPSPSPSPSPLPSSLYCVNIKVYSLKHKTGLQVNKDFTVTTGKLIIERYEIINVLGTAAFSTALKCYDHHTGCTVCLKMIKNVKEYVDQSLDEIKLLTILNSIDTHRRIVMLLDSFYFEEHLFLVTELLGESLFDWWCNTRKKYEDSLLHQQHSPLLAPFPLSLPQLSAWSKDILLGLSTMHTAGMVHADLKPVSERCYQCIAVTVDRALLLLTINLSVR